MANHSVPTHNDGYYNIVYISLTFLYQLGSLLVGICVVQFHNGHSTIMTYYSTVPLLNKLKLLTLLTYIINSWYYQYIFYYIKLKSRLSVCLSALFGRSDSQPWLHGSTSDLLDVIAMSSGMTKFIFKSF